jgi:ribonuclease P protein component
MASQFTLGKKERLKSRKAIDHLFAKGNKKSVQPLRAVYMLTNDKGLLLGAGASNKNFPRATDRNRVKRLIREAWRLQKNELAEKLTGKAFGLHVFILCTDRELPAYTAVTVAVKKIIHLLEKEIESGQLHA